VIGRDWYELTAWALGDKGRCQACGAACVGVFDDQPGRWGRRHAPVRVGIEA
jgi:pyruvate formate lyase activating enzyme